MVELFGLGTNLSTGGVERVAAIGRGKSCGDKVAFIDHAPELDRQEEKLKAS